MTTGYSLESRSKVLVSAAGALALAMSLLGCGGPATPGDIERWTATESPHELEGASFVGSLTLEPELERATLVESHEVKDVYPKVKLDIVWQGAFLYEDDVLRLELECVSMTRENYPTTFDCEEPLEVDCSVEEKLDGDFVVTCPDYTFEGTPI